MATGSKHSLQQLKDTLMLRTLIEAARNKPLGQIIQFEPKLCSLLRLNGSDPQDQTESQLRNRLTKQLRLAPDFTLSELLKPYSQLHQLGDRLGLEEIEKGILLQIVWFSSDPVWRTLSDHLDVTYQGAINLLARIWRVRRSHIDQYMVSDRMLFRSGLMDLNVTSLIDRLDYLFEPLEGLDDSALRYPASWRRVLGTYLPTARPPGGLKGLDFSHIQQEVNLAKQLLGHDQSIQRGIHILLYGSPGTGKTSLAYVLAQMTGRHLYQVALAKSRRSSDSLPRFRSYLLGQSLLRRDKKALLLFDELEDLFPAHLGRFFNDTGSFHKGWINEGLEQAQVSTIWTTNSIEQLDASHLRRFDYVLEVPLPTRRIRKRLLNRTLRHQSIDRQWLDNLAEHDGLTPAFINQIGQLANLLPANGRAMEQVIEPVIRENLRAAGTELSLSPAMGTALPYRLDCINSSMNMDRVAEGLLRTGAGRLCLYGPPGTGKTVYGRHLAHRLDKPLVKKHASDLLSMWMGETEKNIKQMFRQAERENAVLLLDEADSFLQDRSSAERSWEITQVNELLVQMEAFTGVFVATTNLMETLDAASLRRFDLKIQFQYLTLDQLIIMFRALMKTHNLRIRGVNKTIEKQLRPLVNLTPGDFYTVARRLRFSGEPPTQDVVLKSLVEESMAKPGGKRQPIGFVT